MRTPLQYLKDEGLFSWNYRYLITHPWVLFREIYFHIKWFIQRGKRGFADCDTWSIDWYLSHWMPEGIRRLKGGLGFPVTAYEEIFGSAGLDQDWPKENCEKAHQHWQEVLEQIAQGFEAAQKIQDYDVKDQAEMDTQLAIMDNGLNKFRHYFLNLWD